MFQFLFKLTNRFVFKFLAKVTIIDREKAEPIEGGLVVTANHLGFLDGFMVYYATWREDVIVMIAEHWKEHAWSRMLAKVMDAIFVDRFNADLHAVRETMRRLKKGGMLCLAPEGTRSRTGGLIRAHDGAAYLAMKAGVPIVPVAFTGTADPYVFSCWKKFKRPKITVTFGDPFLPPPFPKEGREEAMAALTEEIMLRIAALLPESYRGVYAEHPRLPDFLAK